MKPVTLLLAVSVAAITSCTTSYKSGQTPDDVYYSPARPEADEYVRTEKEDQRRYTNAEDYYDDRYLRMKVRNRTQWSELDDWYYYENRYNYSVFNNIGYSNPWTPYTYWNNYYNPYCHSCCIIVSPKATVAYSKPRTFNLNAYNSNNTALTNKTYSNPKGVRNNSNNTYSAPRNSNSAGSNSNSGNILRDIFGGGGNKSNTSGTTPSSSSNNSSSGSSGSSSGKSGGSAPVRKF